MGASVRTREPTGYEDMIARLPRGRIFSTPRPAKANHRTLTAARNALESRPDAPTLDDFDAVVVRTMPPGSLEQVVFRMDRLHALAARGFPVLNPPRALEVCVDKYLALVRLAAAGLRVPETIVCQH